MTTPTDPPRQGRTAALARAATPTPEDRNRAALERLWARQQVRAAAAQEDHKARARKLAAARSRKARSQQRALFDAKASASKPLA